MTLPGSDLAYLADRGIKHEIVAEGGMTCVVLPRWVLPPGYNHESADLLLRFRAGYPDVPPDMWWFDPALRLTNGRAIPATEATEQHLGRPWQRWSRHFRPGQWKSGIDGLESFLALIRHELDQWVLKTAA
jgi:hypothetical protein